MYDAINGTTGHVSRRRQTRRRVLAIGAAAAGALALGALSRRARAQAITLHGASQFTDAHAFTKALA